MEIAKIVETRETRTRHFAFALAF